jgi:hypothetical protein
VLAPAGPAIRRRAGGTSCVSATPKGYAESESVRGAATASLNSTVRTCMGCSIIHIGVRIRPELAARVVAQVGDESVEVSLDDEVVRRLCGADLHDEEAALVALNHNAREIGIAIEAYVLAGCLPPDGHIVLSWEDVRPTIDELAETGTPARELAAA